MEKLIKKCLHCNEEFQTFYNKTKFCSSSCKNSYHRREKDERFILKWVKKIKAINYLGGECEICKNNNIFNLVFHHISDDKDETISNLFNNRWSVIEKELKKCKLLCNNCHREFHEKLNVKLKYGNQRRKNKEIFISYKNYNCEICGYNKCKSAISFHHKNDKSFNIGCYSKTIENLNDLEEKLILELNKCKLICSNCHQEKHSDKIKFEKYKNIIYNKVIDYKETKPKSDKELVINMFKDGYSRKKIAEKLNISTSTASLILKNNGYGGILTNKN